MLIHPTVERLRALGLTAMADAFIEMQNAPGAAELTREDWLGLLVDREATSRENKRLARRLREAKLRQAAIVEDVNLHAPRGLDRALFQKLATCEWVRDHHHLVVVGPILPGSGASTVSRPASRPLSNKEDEPILVENRQRRGALHHRAELITITRLGDHVRPESVTTFHRIE